MYVLACCDSNGRCFGFLREDKTVERDPDNNLDKLKKFSKKSDTSEICLQINLSHALLPNGISFRVTPVKL